MKNKISRVLILLFAICSCMTIAASAATIDLTTDKSFQPDGTTNLAAGKTPTASSSYEMVNEGWSIAFMTNSKIGEPGVQGWSSNPYDTGVTQTTPAWVQIDLGQKSDISRVVIWPRQDSDPVVGFPIDYTIDISDDGENWTTIATETNQNNVTKAEHKFDFTEVKTGRYIRLNCTKRTVDSRNEMLVQLSEMAVYGVAKSETSPETGDTSMFLALVFVMISSAVCVRLFAKKKDTYMVG